MVHFLLSNTVLQPWFLPRIGKTYYYKGIVLTICFTVCGWGHWGASAGSGCVIPSEIMKENAERLLNVK